MATLHKTQSDVYSAAFVHNVARFFVFVCSRGWGKSFALGASAVTSLFELFELGEKGRNKNVALVAPTFDQAKDIYYPILKNDFSLPSFTVREDKQLGRFIFPNDVQLHLISYEAIERMRGKGYYFIGVDEPSSMRNLADSWENIMYPTISSRWSWMHAEEFGARSAGRAMFGGTPKGYNFLYDLFNYQDTDDDWKSFRFTYKDSPLLSEEEVEKAKLKMDPIRFASEYLADFKESGNMLFYCFDRQYHLQSVESPIEGEDIHCSIDFNVGIQAVSFFVVRGGQMQFFSEHSGSPNTEALGEYIANRFQGHRIFAYPDPSGKSRKTSAPIGTTDFSILKSKGIIVRARSAVPVVDSTNAVNRMLTDANNNCNMFFDPAGCPETIKSMERTRWVDNNRDLALIDKTEGIEHFSDGVRYATDYLFPVKEYSVSVAQGDTF